MSIKKIGIKTMSVKLRGFNNLEFIAMLDGKPVEVKSQAKNNRLYPLVEQELTEDEQEAVNVAYDMALNLRPACKKSMSDADGDYTMPYKDCVLTYTSGLDSAMFKVGSLFIKLINETGFDYQLLYKTFSNVGGEWRDFKTSSMKDDIELDKRIGKQIGFAQRSADRDSDYKVYGFNGSFDALKRYRQSTGQWDKR